jgi:putative two-component system response regulator
METMEHERWQRGRILVADDVALNIKLLGNMLKDAGYDVAFARNGSEVLQRVQESAFDLILLDIMMPGLTGFDVCKRLKSDQSTEKIPVIFLSAKSDELDVVQGFDVGGVDYVTKPFNQAELMARVKTHLKLKYYAEEIEHKNEMLADREVHLTYLVEEKTRSIERLTMAMVNSLENASLFRDEITGKHNRRVGGYAALLAEEFGCDRRFVQSMRLYAPLHDIGKIGISQDILCKPARLDADEYGTMKQHVMIGYRMVADDEIDPLAKNIILYHHEKWNGGSNYDNCRCV